MMADMATLLDSLGWALFHSVWQLALIAALVFAALRLVDRDQPGLRYAIAYAGMVAALVAFIATLAAGFGVKPSSAALIGGADDGGIVAILGRTTGLVSLAWTAGFALLSLRYSAMVRATRQLRRHGLSQVPSHWRERLALWADRLGAGRVTIFESVLVETPLTIGTFKPVVLVPAGFFLRLPRDQAEAILVHELAHICRQDYLFGLVQAFIANVFFFHPAIYYLSRQVDLEREHACDARAALETGDRAALAKGLSRVAIDMHDRRIGFAMAARGRHAVVERIRRLGELRVRSGPDNRTPAIALAMLFGAAIIFAVAIDSRATGAESSDDNRTAVDIAHSGSATVAIAPSESRSEERAARSGEPAARETELAQVDEPAAPSAKSRTPKPAGASSSRDGRVVGLVQTGWNREPAATRRFEPQQPSGIALFQQAVFEMQSAETASGDAQCSQAAEQMERAQARRTEYREAFGESQGERAAALAEAQVDRAEALAELAEARAEAIAEAAEARAEAREERAGALAEAAEARAEAQAEARAERDAAAAERIARDASRRAAMIANDHDRRAEALERQALAISTRASAHAAQIEARAARLRAKIERDYERRQERRARQWRQEISWFADRWGRCPDVTLSFARDPVATGEIMIPAIARASIG